MREITLSPTAEPGTQISEPVRLYDTSGPYTDPNVKVDIRKGLPPLRLDWILERGDVEGERRPLRARPGRTVTQMHYARRGIITPEMEFVAIREGVSPEFVRSEVARGKAVIPANINHPESEPMIIGRNFHVKVNTSFGSAAASSMEDEVERMIWAIRWGADAGIEVTTGKHIHATREWVLRNSPVPIATVPLYEALEKVGGKPEDLTWETFRQTLVAQAEQGVDCFTIHAGVLRDYIPLTARRATGIVSRGGSMMAAWCRAHRQENFLYTHFEEICEIAKAYDVVLSLGDGLRPGSAADAYDEAQLAELKTLGELAKMAWQHDVQVMIEGPWHLPTEKVSEISDRHVELCSGAPFYMLGPIPFDNTLGCAWITSTSGAAIIGWLGTAMLCYLAPKGHRNQPDKEAVRDGVIAYKIAAHAADLARGYPRSLRWDEALPQAHLTSRRHQHLMPSLEPEQSAAFPETAANPGLTEKSRELRRNRQICH